MVEVDPTDMAEDPSKDDEDDIDIEAELDIDELSIEEELVAEHV